MDETNVQLTNGVSLLLGEKNIEQNGACGEEEILIQSQPALETKSDHHQINSNHVTSNHENQCDYKHSSPHSSQKSSGEVTKDAPNGVTSSTIDKKPSGIHSETQSEPSENNNNNNNNDRNLNRSVNKTPEIPGKSPPVSRIPERRHSKIPKLPPSGNSFDSPGEKKSPTKAFAPLSVAPSPQNSTTVIKSQNASLANKPGENQESCGNAASSNSGYYLKSSNSASGIPKMIAKSGIPRPRDSKEPAEVPASLDNAAKAKSSESISQQLKRESFEYKRKGSLKSQIPKLAAASHIA